MRSDETKPEARRPKPVRVFLSLGSNLGDRRAIIEGAVGRLDETTGVRVIRRSSFYETAPVGMADQPWFLNVVVEVETDLSADALLDAAHEVEDAFGRTRAVRWGPRSLDVDILLYGEEIIQTARLAVPHPEMTHRRFVIEPLLEIAPDLVLPGGRPLRNMLRTVLDQDVRRAS